MVGQTLFGTYRVERLLGSGGMGEVYEAAHLRLPTRVAIKILRAEAAANPEIFARFRREAEITSGLRHPGIVQVLDFNHLDDGTPYLVMEHLDGEDLAARLTKGGPLSLLATCALVRAVGMGLAAAHRRGVVHRDLKPQNIFLTRQEHGDRLIEVPKIVDFGISKIRHSVTTDTQRTRDHAVLGTPHYMSPEQARGQNDLVDHRTDQWALAAVAYECLSGRLAYAGDSLAAVVYQVVCAEPPPLRSLRGEVPEAVAAAVARALSKDRDARFPSILEFVEAFAGPEQAGAPDLGQPAGQAGGVDVFAATGAGAAGVAAAGTAGAAGVAAAGTAGASGAAAAGTAGGSAGGSAAGASGAASGSAAGASGAAGASAGLPRGAVATPLGWSGGAAVSETGTRPAPRRPGAPLALAAGLAVLLLGGGALLLTRSRTPEAPQQPTPEAPQQPTPEAPTPQPLPRQPPAAPTAAPPIAGVRYRARLSAQDHRNARGQPLSGAAEILRQDRANYHRYGIRDAEDEADPLLLDGDRRAGAEPLFRAALAPETARQILEGTPLVEVELSADRAAVRVIQP